MGKFLRWICLSLLLLSFAGVAVQAGEPDLNKVEGYTAVVPQQPTQDAGKVEVIEFFWYGCPHCYQFEPHLSEWIRKLPDSVQVIRQPAIFSDKWAPGARAFFVAEALGITDKVHQALFEAVQSKQNLLETREKMAGFFVGQGVSQQDFDNAYDSFIVTTRMRQAENMPARYGVTGVPTIVINGKYRTDGPTAKSFENMINIMNALIESEQSGGAGQ